jgi:sugar lactone lactonase YvrE
MKITSLAWVCGLICWAAQSWGTTSPGGVLWTNQPGGQILGAPAEMPDGSIVVGSNNGYLYAYNRGGVLLWSNRLGDDVDTTPAVSIDGTIFVGVDTSLVALSANGNVKWKATTRGHVLSAPALSANGSVFFGSNDQYFYAVGAEGEQLWSFLTKGKVESAPALAANGALYFGSRDHYFYVVNGKGDLDWSYDTKGDVVTSPAIGPGGIILVGSASRRLYAFDPNGSLIWEYLLPHGAPSSPVISVDRTIYVGSSEGQLYALNYQGQLVWTWVNTNHSALSAPAIAADGTLYVAAVDGKVRAISAKGSLVWTYTAPATMQNQAFNLGSDGNLVLGTDKGHIIALKGTVGPAGSSWPMFRREPAHNAGSFAERQLAKTYSPGLVQLAGISAYPPPGLSSYSVEDQIPSGWAVGGVTHGGQFDSQTRRVKFGPFTDNQPRQLLYELIPPLGDSGNKVFSGVVSAGDWVGSCLGEVYQQLLPLHPADVLPTDGQVTIREAVAFTVAWRQSGSWPTGPSPIPASYVDKATELWRHGEFYDCQTNLTTAPTWWVNSLSGPKPFRLTNDISTPPVLSGSPGTAFCQMTNAYLPGQLVSLAILVQPSDGTTAYAIEDGPPPGWVVSQISHGGVWDAWSKKVKWGPFQDALDRRLTYQVKVPGSPTNHVAFVGQISLNGTNNPVIGQRNLVQGTAAEPWVVRDLFERYAPAWRQTVTLDVHPPDGVSTYVIEDVPPPNWSVVQVSAGGLWDSAHQVVRFGPFFDATPLTLTYDIVPPNGAKGTNSFVGRVLSDQSETMVIGDSIVVDVTLHPADIKPVDSILSLNEVVAYASAWKSGADWSAKPNPIPSSYVVKATDLWQKGESYQFITNSPAGTLPWTPDPTRAPVGISGLNTNFTLATNSTAVAVMPSNWVAGQTITVQLQIIPATNIVVYGVEETPPADWLPKNVSDNGRWDALTGKIKWGPFYDAIPRNMTYALTPPVGGTNMVFWGGIACFDRTGLIIGGVRQMEYLVPPRLEIQDSGPELGLSLLLYGGIGQIYQMQWATNLTDWVNWLLLTNLSEVTVVQDVIPTDADQKIYRAIAR